MPGHGAGVDDGAESGITVKNPVFSLKERRIFLFYES
jgi:hypothetical protein